MAGGGIGGANTYYGPNQNVAAPWWGGVGPGGGGHTPAYDNLRVNAPEGYEYDAVQGTYVPTVGSASNKLANQKRGQGIQDKLIGMLGGLNDSATNAMSGSDGYSGGPLAGGAHVGMDGGSVAPPDASDAQNAAFGAAKAKAGAMGRSAVNSMSSELADRGIMGGGTEARGLTDRLAAATNPLSDLNVAQQHESLGITQHNQDLSNENMKTKYQGDISQRGQDIEAQNAQANRALAARQQKQQMLSQVLTGLMGKVNVGMQF